MNRPGSWRHFLHAAPLVVLPLLASALQSAPAGRVSFNRDIRPIMSDTCFHCHGFDAKARKAGMRLDVREEALKPTKNGFTPIVPGKPDESEIILRIFDRDEPMPPADAHKTLTAGQKDLLRRWVAEGAVYEPHWAYAPLHRPPVPTSPASPASRQSPIDAFVQARLAEKKITPSPEAGKARLLRRLALDLTGLPPAPEELEAFLADRSPNAYAAQVDRLLASPRHGERMAVWWLDIARFADTVGFHGDQNQRIFPYRDYVINAFNTNKRFDQFSIEQLAGDLLPTPTTEQLVATGYNRLNMMTREGGAQPREYLAKYGAERVRSVAAAWFGSTFGCAECHDHKFDPIKSRDFYELQSFFADVKQWGVYHDYDYTPNPELAGFSNDHPFPPEIETQNNYLGARRERLLAQIAVLAAATPAQLGEPASSAAFDAWLADARLFLARQPTGWQHAGVLEATLLSGGQPVADGTVTLTGDGTVHLTRSLQRDESLRITARLEPAGFSALKLEAHDTSPPAANSKKRANPAPLKLRASLKDTAGNERKLEFVFADATAKELRYEHGAEALGIVNGWKIPPTGAPVSGTWLLATPEDLLSGTTLVLTLTGERLPDLRVSTSPFAATDPLSVTSEEMRAAVATVAAARTPAQTQLLVNCWLLSTGVDSGVRQRLHLLAGQIRETRNGRAWSLITQPMQPLPIRVLPRGNWQDETGPVVLPSTPSFLPGRRESTAEQRLTRLDLAQWLVSPQNPLTARVVTNRLWAMFFGSGLSTVIDDLGSQGELPTHPELLDWLASEFRDSGWDLRHMIRLIVMSATYRQNSSGRLELAEVDPANRLLAAQNPRRLDAEFLRDAALFTAGLLNLRDLGGPSVKPYQPAGYYAALQFPDREYVASSDDEQWRRGLYMHWQRTFLHPMLANFDAPARDECAAQRTQSNTPQQALTLLNDPTFVEAARVMAMRVAAAAATDELRLRAAFRRALSRDPKPAERRALLTLLASQREYYQAAAFDAHKLLGIGLTPPPRGDAADLAAWTQVMRVILNAQEFITRY